MGKKPVPRPVWCILVRDHTCRRQFCLCPGEEPKDKNWMRDPHEYDIEDSFNRTANGRARTETQ